MCMSAATTDAGTINAGLVATSETKQRSAFLTVQAALSRPGRWFTFGAVLKPEKQSCRDRTEPIAICGGSGCACRRRQNCSLPRIARCLELLAAQNCSLPRIARCPELLAAWLACPLGEALVSAVLAEIGLLSRFSAKTFEPSCKKRVRVG